jgi:signal transduction histidine kinase
LEVHSFSSQITPEHMGHLFEPYWRGHQQREGIGLGLYIVQQIVRAHGGTIAVESTENGGTTFSVRWPRSVAAHTTARDTLPH